jgi:hypothetical protein
MKNRPRSYTHQVMRKYIMRHYLGDWDISHAKIKIKMYMNKEEKDLKIEIIICKYNTRLPHAEKVR